MATKKSATSLEKKKTGTTPDISTNSNKSTASQVHPRVEFIKSVQFIGLGLDKTNSSLDRAVLSKARKAGANREYELSIKQKVLAHEDHHFVIGASIDLKETIKDSDEMIVSISAEFSARFNLAKPASKELVHAFANVEARLIFFPYIRHFVSDTTYRMSIDPIVLPMTSELEQ